MAITLWTLTIQCAAERILRKKQSVEYIAAQINHGNVKQQHITHFAFNVMGQQRSYFLFPCAYGHDAEEPWIQFNVIFSSVHVIVSRKFFVRLDVCTGKILNVFFF